jgi:hypothetical protein
MPKKKALKAVKTEEPTYTHTLKVTMNGQVQEYAGNSFEELVEKIKPVYPLKTKAIIVGTFNGIERQLPRNSLFMKRLFINKLTRRLLAHYLTISAKS